MVPLPLFSHYPACPPPVEVPLLTVPEQPCPYLPGRMEQCRGLPVDRVPPDVYHAFMNAGFRRSGHILYQPVCRTCRVCQPIRVPVATFAPGKTQRRVWRKNADLEVTVGPPALSTEKSELYHRYQTQWHTGTMSGDAESCRTFLYESPVDTLEFVYRDPVGTLLAVSLCDVCAHSLSSVYCFFEPAAAARSLGTYSALFEIAFARQHAIAYYYLGFLVRGCGAMEYKATFRPFELLGGDGEWRGGGK